MDWQERYKKDRADTLHEMHHERGMSLSEMGKHLGGISKQAVRQRMKAADVPRRSNATADYAEITKQLSERDTVGDEYGSPRYELDAHEASVGDRIQVFRRAMGFGNARDFGDEFGMRWSPQKWERGAKVPSTEGVRRMVWLFQQQWEDFQLSDLLGPMGPDTWED